MVNAVSMVLTFERMYSQFWRTIPIVLCHRGRRARSPNSFQGHGLQEKYVKRRLPIHTPGRAFVHKSGSKPMAVGVALVLSLNGSSIISGVTPDALIFDHNSVTMVSLERVASPE